MCGYDEDETQMKFAKQYNKSNSNINVEAIDLAERKDIQVQSMHHHTGLQ